SFILNWLFSGCGSPPCPKPACLDAADSNDDGSINLADPVFLFCFLFGEVTSLPPPFPVCGSDLTPDGLGCDTTSCEEVICAPCEAPPGPGGECGCTLPPFVELGPGTVPSFVDQPYASKDVQVADLDNDCDLDMFVPQSRGGQCQPDYLYMNLGDQFVVNSEAVNDPADDHDGMGNGLCENDQPVPCMVDFPDSSPSCFFDTTYASVVVDIGSPGGGPPDGFPDIITVNGSDFMRVLIHSGTNTADAVSFVDEGGRVILKETGDGYCPDPNDPTKRIYASSNVTDALGPLVSTSPKPVFKTSLDDLDAGDIDLDGDLDIIVSNRDDFSSPIVFAPNLLLRNRDGNGNFDMQLFPVSLESVETVCHDVVFGDIDNDGDLDLLTVNIGSTLHLFRNRATELRFPENASLEELFEDVTFLLGAQTPSFHTHGAMVDLNNDGFLEIHVGGLAGSNFIYWNDQGVSFTRFPVAFGGYDSAYADLNNDGWKDIVAVDVFSTPPVQIFISCQEPGGDVTFQEVLGVFPSSGWNFTLGVDVGDLDQDGDVDLVVCQGDAGTKVPNRIFLNSLIP
ncbi:MAG: VCBS repeat-containing protein, partial [Planctomycetota bacterium]